MTYNTAESKYGFDVYGGFDMVNHACTMAEDIEINEFSVGSRVLKSSIGGDHTSRMALYYVIKQFINREFDYEDDPHVSHFSSFLQEIAIFLEEVAEKEEEGMTALDSVVDDRSVDELIDGLFKGLVSWSMTRYNEQENERESEKAANAYGYGIRFNFDDPIQSREEVMKYVVASHPTISGTSIYRREENGAYTRFWEPEGHWSFYAGAYYIDDLHDVRIATYGDLSDRGISLDDFYRSDD